jgi:hypothetical protein
MHVTLSLILMVAAFILLTLAAFGVPSGGKPQLGWLGLACWALAILVGGVSLG